MNFQLVELNGKSVPFNGHIDNVRVPERGEVKIRLAFTNPRILGQFVYHCPILEHEDKGMMANIEIYDPAEEDGALGALRRLWRSVAVGGPETGAALGDLAAALCFSPRR